MQKWNPHANKIFAEAMEIDSADERDQFIQSNCEGEPELVKQVCALINAAEKSESFLEFYDKDSGTKGIFQKTDAAGQQIGPYKLREKIGEGGFGVVYVAEQKEPVSRKVALKVIKPGMDSQDVIARFEAERQALAMMDHPNVARVLDAGATESGRPYFVMELVHGVGITEYCDSKKLSNRQRLELFIDVCHAVQHAHQKGIIHRDLKPSNVMVTMADHRPVVKVIDFGVAKALHHDLTGNSIYTGYGQMIGTPMYMSPEQAQMSSLDVDTRSDIYSLGVLLYELLTGTTPFDKETFKQADFDEMRRMIREVEPRRPSEQVSTLKAEQISTISDSRKIDHGTLVKSLRGELDWIVLKTLEKDRTRRYETATSLAEDVRRVLNDEPVSACPPSTLYRLRKFARRNKVGFAFASLTTLFLFTGLIGLAVANYMLNKRGSELAAALGAAEKSREQAVLAMKEADKNSEIANANADEAEREAATSAAVIEFVNSDLLGEADPHEQPDRNLKVADLLRRAELSVGNRFANQPLVEARIRTTLAKAYHNLGSLSEADKNLRIARDLYERQLGPESINCLEARRDLIWLRHFREEDFEECLLANQQILKLTSEKHGEHHPLALKTAMYGADYKQHLGQYREVEAEYQRLMPIMEETLGADHEDTIELMAKLANVMAIQDRHREAEQMFRSALERQVRRAGTEVVLVVALVLRKGIAECMIGQGQVEDATKMLAELLEQFQEILGSDHITTIKCQISLAKAHSVAGDHQDAIAMLKAALEMQQSMWGEQDKRWFLTANELALAYSKSGHPERALPIHEKLLERLKADYGSQHPYTLGATISLGATYLALERISDALSLFEGLKSHADLIESWSHKNYLVFLNDLGVAHLKSGQSSKALSAFKELLRRQELALGTSSPEVAAAKAKLGNTYRITGAIDKAIVEFQEAIEILDALSDPPVYLKISTSHVLGDAYVRVGKRKEGVALQEQALNDAKSKLPQNHPLVDTITQNLAATYWRMNRPNDAIPLFEQTLDRFEKRFGRYDIRTQMVVANLAANYKLARKFDRAIPLLEESFNSLKGNWQWIGMGTHLVDAHVEQGDQRKAEDIANELRDWAGQMENPDAAMQLSKMRVLIAIARDYYLKLQDYPEAETCLREAIEIADAHVPERLNPFYARSLLGETLIHQKDLESAESILLSGHEGLVERRDQISPMLGDVIEDSLNRLVSLYEAKNELEPIGRYQAELELWRNKLANYKATRVSNTNQ